MRSSASRKFWQLYNALPRRVRRQANKAYHLWFDNPSHPNLQFKRVHTKRPIYSVRITRDFRALGLMQDDEVLWFWIGSHSDYDKLISGL